MLLAWSRSWPTLWNCCRKSRDRATGSRGSGTPMPPRPGARASTRPAPPRVASVKTSAIPATENLFLQPPGAGEPAASPVELDAHFEASRLVENRRIVERNQDVLGQVGSHVAKVVGSPELPLLGVVDRVVASPPRVEIEDVLAIGEVLSFEEEGEFLTVDLVALVALERQLEDGRQPSGVDLLDRRRLVI